jgi:hypothetical protein
MNYNNSSPMIVFLSILYLFMSYVYVFTIKYLFYGKLYMFLISPTRLGGIIMFSSPKLLFLIM